LLAELFIPNPENKPYVDHINNKRSEDGLENLRWTTVPENRLNSKKTEKTTSCKYKGVAWHKATSKWRAYAKKDGKQVALGYFASDVDAAKAYDSYMRENFPEYSSFNFSEDGPTEEQANQESDQPLEYGGQEDFDPTEFRFALIEGFDDYIVFENGVVYNWRIDKIVRGSVDKEGYHSVHIFNSDGEKILRVHILVAKGFIPNPENKKFVDHIDGNRGNNSSNNLRWATSQENSMNKKKKSTSTSKYKGVSWNSGRGLWEARIKTEYKHEGIGYFETEEEAARAYNDRAVEVFGEFASINKLPNLEDSSSFNDFINDLETE
jgi:hypothetical protein